MLNRVSLFWATLDSALGPRAVNRSKSRLNRGLAGARPSEISRYDMSGLRFCCWLGSISRRSGVPDSRNQQNYRAASGKRNQEGGRQHKPGDHGRRRRQPGAEVAIKCTGSRSAEALIEDGLQRLLILRQTLAASIRTNHVFWVRLGQAFRANSPTAVRANGHSICCAMLEALHNLGSMSGLGAITLPVQQNVTSVSRLRAQ